FGASCDPIRPNTSSVRAATSAVRMRTAEDMSVRQQNRRYSADRMLLGGDGDSPPDARCPAPRFRLSGAGASRVATLACSLSGDLRVGSRCGGWGHLTCEAMLRRTLGAPY